MEQKKSRIPNPPEPTEEEIQQYASTKRRSFYVEDDLWYSLQSKLWAKKSNASRWIREQIEEYLAKH
jgi:hypothetical protein